ncbi:MAG: hypothetical protein LBR29_11475 [Methylobacteriaceae bacterium]|jgi:hypothetical protein|nr:hypothetical protein [Methylobacteriaceae bacterium]
MNTIQQQPPVGAELTVTNLLKATAYIFSRNMLQYILLSLACILLTLGLQKAFTLSNIPLYLPGADGASGPTNPEGMIRYSTLLTGYLLLSQIMSSVWMVLPAAVITYGVMQRFRGRSFTFGEGLAAVQSRLVPLVWISVAYVIVVTAAGMLFVVPGVVFMLLFMLVVPVCVLERRGFFASFQRSARMISEFPIYLKAFAALGVVYLFVFLSKAIVAQSAPAPDAVMIGVISAVEAVGVALVTVLESVVYFYVLYHLERKNADDVAAGLGLG